MLKFSDIFAGYTQKYGRYVVGVKNGDVKKKGEAATVDGPITDEIWQGHLSGFGAGIGTIPLNDEDCCVYGAIDVDEYKGLDFVKLEKDTARLPIIICKSKSGGAHLFMFFNEQVPAVLVQSRLAEIAAALGWGRSEIFPKQTKRVDPKLPGNWINLPYFGDTRRCFFEGQEIPLEEFLQLVERRQVGRAWLENFKILKDAIDEKDFTDGPLCLQHLESKGIPEGTRNVVLFNQAIYYKRKYGAEHFEDKLAAYNQAAMRPPVTNRELQNVVGSVKKKDYHYECAKEPLCQYCDRRACQKRKFGIGSSNSEMTVVMTNLIKITTEPPMYRVDVFDGVHVATINIDTIEELLSPKDFKHRCAEKLNKVLPVITQRRWDDTMEELMRNMQEEEAPDNASEKGQILDCFVDFVNKYLTTADDYDCLFKGQVLLKDEIVQFRGANFFEFLKNAGFRNMNSRKVWVYMREAGIDKSKMRIGHHTVNIWSIPEKLFKELTHA